MKAYRVLSDTEALAILAHVKRADWEPGRKADGVTAKRNRELRPEDGDEYWPAAERIRQAVTQHKDLMGDTLLCRTTFPTFNRYGVGETYGQHYDASPMGDMGMRTDYSCTVFLTPPEDYDGGELEVDGFPPVKMAAGCCVVYPCGALHQVRPVTRGERISAVLWGRSLIRDRQQREVLVTLTDILTRMQASGEPMRLYDHHYTALTGIQSHLARMWFDA